MKNSAKIDKTVGKYFEDINSKNSELLAAFTLYRYNCELKMIEEGIEANKQIPTRNESKVKQVTIDNTVNAFRRWKTQKFSDKKKICQDNIEDFQEKCKKDGIKLHDVSAESLKKMTESMFKNDQFGLQKICFAMIVYLQNSENDFIYGDETLKDVSAILFDDENRIKSISDKFFENFKEISNGSFWERNKKLLIGIGVSMLIAVIFGSVVFSGAALLGIGGLGISELIKSGKVKEAFRQLKPDDIAALFAMKATLIDYGMPAMGEERFKKELDECLVGLNDLRADLEYMLIVEKNDTDNSKKKIQVCNRFVDRLALIAGA